MTSMVRAGMGVALAPVVGACVVLVAVADYLFFGRSMGWTLGAYGLLLMAFAVIHNRALLRHRSGKLFFLLGAGACLALVESLNFLALVLFAWCFGLLLSGVRREDTAATVFCKLTWLSLHIGGGSVFGDLRAYNRYYHRVRSIGFLPGIVRGWLLPAALSVVFVGLFAAANPVIDKWLTSPDWRVIDQLLTPGRVVFWCFVAVLCWGVLRSRRLRPGVAASAAGVDTTNASWLTGLLFSREAVLRSLAVFNLMFLTQNLLDANFLWAGAALPEGVTYAEYAHRGAYPLIATALLAAAFVLVALRQGSPFKGDRAIRGLIYLWLLQNMVLVFGSIWRTNIYIAEYSLTYLRLSALLWMGLVLLGLIFIVLKIVLEKPSRWLVGANLLAAFALLYVSCFLDLGRFIADYNVAHCREMQGSGYALDYAYLRGIGPSELHGVGPAALPALRRLEQHLKETNQPVPRELDYTIGGLTAELDGALADWRRWTFRAYRLGRELGRPLTI